MYLQAVIQSPFTNGGSPTPDAQTGETRFTYFPTVSADQVTTQQPDVTANAAALGQVTAAGGKHSSVDAYTYTAVRGITHFSYKFFKPKTVIILSINHDLLKKNN